MKNGRLVISDRQSGKRGFWCGDRFRALPIYLGSIMCGVFLSIFMSSCTTAAGAQIAAKQATAQLSATETRVSEKVCPTSGNPVSFCGSISPTSTLVSVAVTTAGIGTAGPQVDLGTLASTASLPTPITSLPTPIPTSCPPDYCSYSNQLMLQRPIAPPGVDTIENSYRFGSTQDGKRDPHHGVEFLNPLGTPVLAAADGEVVVAGDDLKTFYGPYSYFYGNLVVIKHQAPGLSQPLFTLYGHLSQILVHVGDSIQVGQEIGKVGMSGVATGSHLHFEVRLGENSYKNSRNPELWLAPLVGKDGIPMGALAARVLDVQGNNLPVKSIVLEHLPAPGQPADYTSYLQSYEEKSLIGQPPWSESFGSGDLPAGLYSISFVQNGMQNRLVQILPGQLAVVTFRVGGR